MTTIHTKIKRLAMHVPYAAAAFVLIGAGPACVAAQDMHGHLAPQQPAATQTPNVETLIKIVRDATERFKDVAVAKAEGYALQFGCVSGDDSGAMGMHYVNGDLVNSGVIDATHPQIVIYEPMPNGTLKLIGADYLVIADQWNATHSDPPQLMGQLFHLFEAPNRFKLPAFYTLHVWAWKENPSGAFVNWHPNVSCQSFTGQQQ
jgi:hypothetical protein